MNTSDATENAPADSISQPKDEKRPPRYNAPSDPFTRILDAFFDHVLVHLTEAEGKLAMFLLRKTQDWDRPVAVNVVLKALGWELRNFQKNIKVLQQLGIITVKKAAPAWSGGQQIEVKFLPREEYTAMGEKLRRRKNGEDFELTSPSPKAARRSKKASQTSQPAVNSASVASTTPQAPSTPAVAPPCSGSEPACGASTPAPSEPPHYPEIPDLEVPPQRSRRPTEEEVLQALIESMVFPEIPDLDVPAPRRASVVVEVEQVEPVVVEVEQVEPEADRVEAPVVVEPVVVEAPVVVEVEQVEVEQVEVEQVEVEQIEAPVVACVVEVAAVEVTLTAAVEPAVEETFEVAFEAPQAEVEGQTVASLEEVEEAIVTMPVSHTSFEEESPLSASDFGLFDMDAILSGGDAPEALAGDAACGRVEEPEEAFEETCDAPVEASFEAPAVEAPVAAAVEVPFGVDVVTEAAPRVIPSAPASVPVDIAVSAAPEVVFDAILEDAAPRKVTEETVQAEPAEGGSVEMALASYASAVIANLSPTKAIRPEDALRFAKNLLKLGSPEACRRYLIASLSKALGDACVQNPLGYVCQGWRARPAIEKIDLDISLTGAPADQRWRAERQLRQNRIIDLTQAHGEEVGRLLEIVGRLLPDLQPETAVPYLKKLLLWGSVKIAAKYLENELPDHRKNSKVTAPLAVACLEKNARHVILAMERKQANAELAQVVSPLLTMAPPAAPARPLPPVAPPPVAMAPAALPPVALPPPTPPAMARVIPIRPLGNVGSPAAPAPVAAAPVVAAPVAAVPMLVSIPIATPVAAPPPAASAPAAPKARFTGRPVIEPPPAEGNEPMTPAQLMAMAAEAQKLFGSGPRPVVTSLRPAPVPVGTCATRENPFPQPRPIVHALPVASATSAPSASSAEGAAPLSLVAPASGGQPAPEAPSVDTHGFSPEEYQILVDTQRRANEKRAAVKAAAAREERVALKESAAERPAPLARRAPLALVPAISDVPGMASLGCMVGSLDFLPRPS